MKKFIISLLVLSSSYCYSQNVGVGTNTPASKFSVGNNSQFRIDNIGNIEKINDVPYSFPFIQGTNGQVLTNDGTGQLNWVTASSIITLNEFNYLNTTLSANNIVRIDGILNLTQELSVLNHASLHITGGQIIGNGSVALRIGNNVTFTGTTFSDVELRGNSTTYINCKFSGSIPRVGSVSDNEVKFYNCTFSNATVGSIVNYGTFFDCLLENTAVIRALTFNHCTIDNCTIGSNSLNGISNCKIQESTIYALSSEFQFLGNRCDETKLTIGNASNAPTKSNICNNIFDGVLEGSQEILEINPSDNPAKFININNNVFLLQPSDPRSIAVVADEGFPTRSFLNIQGNIFYSGLNTLVYNSNLKTIYSNNIASRVDHPDETGELVVLNNYD